MDAAPSPFGELLRRHRAAAGLTQAELAERAGLSARGVSDLERGARRAPRRATLARLAAGLRLPAAERAALAAAGRRPRAPVGPRPPPNLPLPLTSFVGRARELAEVAALLPTTRLLTLTGAGGVGKSRLALAAAERARAAYPDGAWLVELAALADPGLVPHAVAAALGVREQPGRPPAETLAAWLAGKRLLLVLDNCEHLLDACAQLAEALLRAAPGLTILATSRERLSAAGEVAWRVPPLAAPAPGAPAAPAALTCVDAARLFVARAGEVAPGFALTGATAAAVAAICRRLDGIPLALELAAAWAATLSPEQIAMRLDDSLRLLTGGRRTAPARQRTLRATLDWSHALLTGPERALLRRLAVFAGGFTVEAAEAVGAGGYPALGLGPAALYAAAGLLVWRSRPGRAAAPRAIGGAPAG
jgi:non-specific serine/threonine protein kinase